MQIEVHARPAVPVETTDAWEKVRDSFAYHGRVAVARSARCRALPPRVAARAPEAGFHRLFGGLFSRRPAHPGLRGGAQHQAARRDHVCARRDRHRHLLHRGPRDPPRRLPGLRAPHDRLPALARLAGALRQRLSAHHRAASRRPRNRRWSATALRMPGCRCGVRPTAGSNSIRPMAASPAPTMWPWPGDAISATCRRCAA